MTGNATNYQMFNSVKVYRVRRNVCKLHTYRKEMSNPGMELMRRICTGRRNKVEMEGGNKFDKSFTINTTLNHETECLRLAWPVQVHSMQYSGRWNISKYECVQPCIIARVILPLEEPP